MEFKGTKGEWEVSAIVGRNLFGKPQATIKVKRSSGLYDIVANVYGKQIPDTRANAVLIEHTPEMLDMLINILDNQDSECHLDKSINDMIKDLITRATTI